MTAKTDDRSVLLYWLIPDFFCGKVQSNWSQIEIDTMNKVWIHTIIFQKWLPLYLDKIKYKSLLQPTNSMNYSILSDRGTRWSQIVNENTKLTGIIHVTLRHSTRWALTYQTPLHNGTSVWHCDAQTSVYVWGQCKPPGTSGTFAEYLGTPSRDTNCFQMRGMRNCSV